jgi:carboxypeptidase Q
MKRRFIALSMGMLLIVGVSIAQDDQVIANIIKEANENSQLENLAHELMDVVGPRLVGTPQMKNANDWAVQKYAGWNISAENQEWGEWRGWERGITHVDMVSPRVVTLNAMQLAWSPNGPKKGIKNAEVVGYPTFENAQAFTDWLPSVKGKVVMVSMPQPTGRPNYNWDKFGTDESIDKMKKDRAKLTEDWNKNIRNTGFSSRTIAAEIEKAGAVAIFSSRWSRAFGANKIFSAGTKEIPNIDVSLEDYAMLYRLFQYGDSPKVNIVSESKELGNVPVFNTIATIKGAEKPGEYVILSAHFDSWDGGTGATDNGTGSILMMEVMRILKKHYPNPKRTILVGHWGSEEQGLNGSRSFVEDHPEIVDNIQVVFNQDNGTGRAVNLSGQGFLNSYDYLGRWMAKVPRKISSQIKTNFPGTPGGGGSDYASFVAAGAPAFSLSSLDWDYFTYTWHTNIDTYDKIVFDDVRSNVVLAAIMAYMASEDPETTSRDRSVLPLSRRTGEQMTWPQPRKSTRKGGQN